MQDSPSQRAAIVGLGHTALVRKTERSLGSFAAEAALNAIRDAGLRPSDIDGYAGNPHAHNPTAKHWDGIDEISAAYLASTLGLTKLRWQVDMARGLCADSVIAAVNALRSGLCTHALVVRAMRNPMGVRYARTDSAPVGGPGQFSAPYGLDGGIGVTALWLRRYLHEHGASRRDLYPLARTLREHALANPCAYWKTPLTEEEYFGAKTIFEPMSRYDCDTPVTGAAALVLTRADRARDLPHKPAYVAGIAMEWEPPDTVFEASRIGRREIQAAQLYDGFLPGVWYWLEKLRLCPPGEAPAFTASGNIGLRGLLPVNTFGGAVSEGRLNGMGHVHEAALQVMQRAGARQVPGLSACLVSLGLAFLGAHGSVLMLSAN